MFDPGFHCLPNAISKLWIASLYFQYDFLERQLADKAVDKPKIPSLFSRAHRERTTSNNDLTESNSQIKKEMEELKKKLDSLDRGE